MTRLLALWLVASAFFTAGLAHAEGPQIGIVVMHGKGGSPNRLVNGLASALESKGMLVANLEMPWSKKREYDVPTEAAEQEILAALAGLKARGAQKLFVAGHSQGGAFALHFGGRHPVDGIICMAPGGNVNTPFYVEKIIGSLDEARKLVAAGKGREKVRLNDFEGSKGSYPIDVTPENYLSWFDAAGAMNMDKVARNVKVPVLWLIAARDYPSLRKANFPMFRSFPTNPLHKLAEPDADHLGTPAASIDLIVDWTASVP
jgi:pimeloyl-ACP methyl ester carboxylesterase